MTATSNSSPSLLGIGIHFARSGISIAVLRMDSNGETAQTLDLSQQTPSNRLPRTDWLAALRSSIPCRGSVTSRAVAREFFGWLRSELTNEIGPDFADSVSEIPVCFALPDEYQERLSIRNAFLQLARQAGFRQATAVGASSAIAEWGHRNNVLGGWLIAMNDGPKLDLNIYEMSTSQAIHLAGPLRCSRLWKSAANRLQSSIQQICDSCGVAVTELQGMLLAGDEMTPKLKKKFEDAGVSLINHPADGRTVVSLGAAWLTKRRVLEERQEWGSWRVELPFAGLSSENPLNNEEILQMLRANAKWALGFRFVCESSTRPPQLAAEFPVSSPVDWQEKMEQHLHQTSRWLSGELRKCVPWWASRVTRVNMTSATKNIQRAVQEMRSSLINQKNQVKLQLLSELKMKRRRYGAVLEVPIEKHPTARQLLPVFRLNNELNGLRIGLSDQKMFLLQADVIPGHFGLNQATAILDQLLEGAVECDRRLKDLRMKPPAFVLTSARKT